MPDVSNTDPAGPGNPAPRITVRAAVMTGVLLGLLAILIVLQWRKSSRPTDVAAPAPAMSATRPIEPGPSVPPVAEQPASTVAPTTPAAVEAAASPVSESAPPALTEAPASSVTEPPPAKKLSEEDQARFDALMREARGLLRETSKLDAAREKLEAARALNDDPEVARLVGMIEEEKDRLRQGEKVGEILRTTDELRRNRNFGEAVRILEAAGGAFPKYDALLQTKLADARREKENSDRIFNDALKAARAAREAGELERADEQVRRAAAERPDDGEAKALKEEIQRALALQDMILVPAGDFVMGGPEREDEKPLRPATLGAFYIDVYEVTNEKYLRFIKLTGARPPRSWPGGEIPAGWEKHPVCAVSYVEAAAYAAFAGKRIPAEAEWEKAARYIDGRRFPWGDVFKPREWMCNSAEYGIYQPTAVGKFAEARSIYGCHDMAGNVWEWTTTSVEVLEADGMARYNVLKGGSFLFPESAQRCSNRLLQPPTIPLPDVGFRCVRDP